MNTLSLFFTIFSVGIAIGSLLCEKLSDKKVELGLVPFGSIGLTCFGVDLYFATMDYNPKPAPALVSLFKILYING
jgi:hypothetical protein